MAFFKQYEYSIEKVPALSQTVITVPCNSQHPPNPFSILLHGCKRKSASKDHSNMVDSSMACCWVGQSGARKTKRRKKSAVVSSGWSSSLTEGLFPSKHMIFFFQVPVLWGGGHIPIDISPKVLHYLLKFLTPFLYSPYETYPNPPLPQCIIPVGVCHQILLGALAYKN